MRVRRAVPYSTVKLIVMRPPEGVEPLHDEPQNGDAPKPPAELKPLQKLEIPVKLGRQ
jgi:hypothetical protein